MPTPIWLRWGACVAAAVAVTAGTWDCGGGSESSSCVLLAIEGMVCRQSVCLSIRGPCCLEGVTPDKCDAGCGEGPGTLTRGVTCEETGYQRCSPSNDCPTVTTINQP